MDSLATRSPKVRFCSAGAGGMRSALSLARAASKTKKFFSTYKLVLVGPTWRAIFLLMISLCLPLLILLLLCSPIIMSMIILTIVIRRII